MKDEKVDKMYHLSTNLSVPTGPISILPEITGLHNLDNSS